MGEKRLQRRVPGTAIVLTRRDELIGRQIFMAPDVTARAGVTNYQQRFPAAADTVGSDCCAKGCGRGQTLLLCR